MARTQEVLKNDQGQIISGKRRLRDERFGTGEYKDEEPLVDWEKFETSISDEHGFDIRNREDNGNYLIECFLPQGTVLIRYGPEGGHYSAPEGTDYDMLSLPYERETVTFRKYCVNSSALKVYRKVMKGRVAPMFDSAGGAVQYYHKLSIHELVRNKTLERIEL